MISIMDRSSASWKFIALKLNHMSHFGHHTPSLAANSHSVAVFGSHAAMKLGPRSKKRYMTEVFQRKNGLRSETCTVVRLSCKSLHNPRADNDVSGLRGSL
jgi:hypothetical protein